MRQSYDLKYTKTLWNIVWCKLVSSLKIVANFLGVDGQEKKKKTTVLKHVYLRYNKLKFFNVLYNALYIWIIKIQGQHLVFNKYIFVISFNNTCIYRRSYYYVVNFSWKHFRVHGFWKYKRRLYAWFFFHPLFTLRLPLWCNFRKLSWIWYGHFVWALLW